MEIINLTNNEYNYLSNELSRIIDKYKKIEYVPVEYPPTSEIIGEIEALNNKIIEETAELKKLLGI